MAPRSAHSVTLLRLDDCPGAATLRAYLTELQVPFTEVTLGPSSDMGDNCGYVSPSLQLESGRITDLLVRPTNDEAFDALRRGGHLRRQGIAGRRQAGMRVTGIASAPPSP
jgi:hypothetical protein